MTKPIKTTFIFLISALVLCIVGFFCTSGVHVSRAADTTSETKFVKNGLSDDNFGWTNGCALKPKSFEQAAGMSYKIDFTLNLKTPSFQDINDGEGTRKDNYWGSLSEDCFTYKYTLYGVDKTGAGVQPLTTYLIKFLYDDSTKMNMYVLYKKLSFDCPGFAFSFGYTLDADVTDMPEKCKNQSGTTGVKNFAKENGYEFMFHYLISATDLEKQVLTVATTNPYASYFVRYEYEHKTMSYTGIFTTNYAITAQGAIDSATVSIYDELKELYDAGELSGYFASANSSALDEAQDIINNYNVEQIKVQYLEVIDGTPFAKKATAYVTVPVINSTVKPADVSAALGVSLDCLNSYAERFTLVDGVYVAYYLKSSCVKSQTTDGNTVEFYLDINKSFQDYYYPFVEDGVMVNDCYEFMFNGLVEKYPALNGMTYSDVHGHFGFIPIPDGSTLNDLWATLFTQTSNVGVINLITYDSVLSLSQYYTLRDKYEYAFLANVFESLIDIVTLQSTKATYYCIYSEPGTNFAIISEAGNQDVNDTSSAIGNGVDEIGAFVGGIWDTITGSNSIFMTVIIASAVIIVAKMVTKKKK